MANALSLQKAGIRFFPDTVKAGLIKPIKVAPRVSRPLRGLGSSLYFFKKWERDYDATESEAL
ncbi:hypothetical protein B4100_2230 [Heyndrickxia coagulans]|nr:hypothetical protein B4100_2230 [Heyndrickxia coagulans]